MKSITESEPVRRKSSISFFSETIVSGLTSSANFAVDSTLSFSRTTASLVGTTIVEAGNLTSSTVSAVATSVVSVVESVSQVADNLQPDPMIRLRPSWNLQFGMAIKVLKVAANNIPRDVQSIRMLTDHGIPQMILPWGVSNLSSTVPPGEWTYPSEYKFDTEGVHIPDDATVILYFHGGAFCCCGTGTHRGLIFRLVKATGAIVFAVDYRRPPEFPFPTPIEDCVDAYKYLLTTVEPNRIFFAGDSAGGGLVASVAITSAQRGCPKPAGGILLSPWVDLADVGITDSWFRNQKYDYLPEDLAALFAEAYKGPGSNDGLVSPLFSSDLDLLPPLHVEVGGCEVLHDQILAFCDKVRASGVPVDVRVREDMVHVFCLFSFSGMQQCVDAYHSIAAFILKVRKARTARDGWQVGLGDDDGVLIGADGEEEEELLEDAIPGEASYQAADAIVDEETQSLRLVGSEAKTSSVGISDLQAQLPYIEESERVVQQVIICQEEDVVGSGPGGGPVAEVIGDTSASNEEPSPDQFSNEELSQNQFSDEVPAVEASIGTV